jgi:predicted GIY-YIG superfamily endonuclease
MAIDGCQQKFIELALEVFPRYLDELRAASPIPMIRFCCVKDEVTKLRRELFPAGSYSGCYLLLDRDKAEYVGISRDVFARLRQHITGKTHYDASLAYRMAKVVKDFNGTRDEAMQDAAFLEQFNERRSFIQSLSCSFVRIDNPLELYLFEAFCSMELDTGDWNTFVTH